MRYIILLSIFLLQACGLDTSPQDTNVIRYDSHCTCLPKRVASGLAYSPAFVWPSSPLNVCFDNGTTEQRRWVKDAINRTWGNTSALRLTWRGCVGAPQEVHINFDDHLVIENIGVELNWRKPGLTLGDYAREDEYLFRTQAVYGFGFVLGFTAEQDRGDSPCTNIRRFPAYAQRHLGPWDNSSVMNDCNPVRYNGGLLSDGDVAGMQRVYGEAETCDCN